MEAAKKSTDVAVTEIKKAENEGLTDKMHKGVTKTMRGERKETKTEENEKANLVAVKKRYRFKVCANTAFT
jgi:hypothetical protein